jgi:hypothetical protein
VRRCPVKLKNNAWFDTPKKGENHVKQVFLPGYDSTSIFHNLSIYIVYVSEFFWYVQPKLSCVHEEWWWYCDMRPCFFFHMFLDSQIPSRPSSPSTQSLEESSRPEINATYPDVYIVNC